MIKNKAKKKKKIVVKKGQAHVSASYNNTIITLTDQNGNTLVWGSAGAMGFKGPKKATPYAAEVICREIIAKAKTVGLEEVDVFVKGVGAGREGAIRALHSNGLNIMSIKDVTPIPHNGCRPPKPRRV